MRFFSFGIPATNWRVVAFFDLHDWCTAEIVKDECDEGAFSWWGVHVGCLFVLAEHRADGVLA